MAHTTKLGFEPAGALSPLLVHEDMCMQEHTACGMHVNVGV